MSKIRDILELIRLPNVFTSHADIVAGFLVAGGYLYHWRSLLLLLLSSTFLYSAGIALNDYFDYAIDLVERPQRPIPSGRVKRETALALGMIFILAGVVSASLVGSASLIISLFLVAAILSYDGGMKRNVLFGPLNMGLCRYLNFLLGLSVLSLSGSAFWIPMLTGLFIVGVTAVSRYETGESPRFPVLYSVITTAAVPLLYMLLQERGIFSGWPGAVLCLIWTAFILSLLFYLSIRRNAETTQRVVKYMILSLIGLDGIIVTGARGVSWALPVWALWAPAIIAGKKFYAT